jgi:membrane protease subunit (stomatin/prohibitin family)
VSFIRNFIGNELIDIVEWLDETPDTMVWRFDRPRNEIKNGAQLIVRPSQVAVFVDQGHIADVFQPGRYHLTTQNLPILSTLRGWKYGFRSPFKAEVLFVSTRQFTNQKWGTKNPIMLRDAEFGPVRLRAFGNFSVRVKDAPDFVREIVGTNAHFTVEQIGDQLRDMTVARFSDAIGEGRIPILELAANYSELGNLLAERIQPEFAEYGLEVTKVVVENISLPPEVEQALDRRTSMGIVGDLNQYTQFRTAEAIGDAARNPGGAGEGMGAGLGAGMGFGMAQRIGQAMSMPSSPPPSPAAHAAGPPPLPDTPQFYLALDGEQAGPFSAEVLRGYVQAGTLTRDTLVWRDGMPQWTHADEVPGVANLFGAVPPPLPPR